MKTGRDEYHEDDRKKVSLFVSLEVSPYSYLGVKTSRGRRRIALSVLLMFLLSYSLNIGIIPALKSCDIDIKNQHSIHSHSCSVSPSKWDKVQSL